MLSSSGVGDSTDMVAGYFIEKRPLESTKVLKPSSPTSEPNDAWGTHEKINMQKKQKMVFIFRIPKTIYNIPALAFSLYYLPFDGPGLIMSERVCPIS